MPCLALLVAEYNDLAQGQVNNGFMNIERRELLSIECIQDGNVPINDPANIKSKRGRSLQEDEDDDFFINPDSDFLLVTFREEVHYNYGADQVYRVGQHVHEFAVNSSLLLSYRSQLDPVFIDAVSDNVPTPEVMCNEAALRCTGEIFPYDSLQECYETLSSVPHSCTPEGERCYNCVLKNTVFSGDTLQCRSLHMLSAKMRPTVHCAHLGSDSDRCRPEGCPAFVERKSIEETRDELAPFEASLSKWFRIVEIIIAALLFFLPILSFVSFRKSRRLVFPEPGYTPSRNSKIFIPVLDDAAALKLPKLSCALRLRYTGEEKAIMSARNIDFGGCKMTALCGKSGSGKSTLMKMVCGFQQSHMILEMEVRSHKIETAYVPQSTDMWPRFMPVRDIFLFTAKMQGCHLSDYSPCIDTLSIRELLNQTFATLSGGQQQRVHILANLIQRKPSLVFMDEPVSALDEDNAAACLGLLHNLPIQHSFVIAMHQMTPRLQAYFDRILEIDMVKNKLIKKHFTLESVQQSQGDEADFAIEEGGNALDQSSLVNSVRSLFFLWHALFWAWPYFDVGVVLLGILNAVILGAMGANSLETDGILVDFVPSSIGTRIPVFLLQFIANIAALSAFVVALVYSIEDRKLLFHFSKQGKLNPDHVVVFNFFRFAFYGIIFATILLAIPLAMMQILESGAELDTLIMNSALFSTSYTMLCYVLAQLVPPLYSSQILLLTFLPMTLFTGVFFPWDTLTTIFRIFHYMNPLFWCLTASSHVLLETFDARCGPSDDPYITCALSDAIASISQLQDLSSLHSQCISALFLIISMIGLYWTHRRSATYCKLGGNYDHDMDDHESEHCGPVIEPTRNPSRASKRISIVLGRRGPSNQRQTRAQSWLDVSGPELDGGDIPQHAG